ncbi:MAG: hypothetical protein ACOC1F_06055, partial [Myxococcota bacterium]
TLFGATPELLSFRRAVGYELVRIGSSRGTRTGEPSAVMLRAGTERGAALIRSLREDLARDLPLQLELLEAEGELALDPRLASSLGVGLEPAVELEQAAVRARVQRYLAGPQTAQAAAYALDRFVRMHGRELASMEAKQRGLIEGRVVARRSWRRVAREAGYPSVPAAMRALRPAIRVLYALA